jgi:hypothetical protein
MRGVFALDEPTGGRWEIGLDVLRRGEAISLGQITFRQVDSQTVEAAVASAWLPMDLTEERARTELEQAQVQVNELLSEDAAFRDSIGGSAINLVLVHDYETGSLPLCRIAAEGVEWLGERPA